VKLKRYRVVVLDGGELASPGASSPAPARRRLGLLARWWRWSWQLRLASVCVLLGIIILVVR
jgi:hypothetical protein